MNVYIAIYETDISENTNDKHTRSHYYIRHLGIVFAVTMRKAKTHTRMIREWDTFIVVRVIIRKENEILALHRRV